MDLKKQNISLRMNTSDLRKVKQIAQRLERREADVFRFAIKSTLAKLAPLSELQACGSDLLKLRERTQGKNKSMVEGEPATLLREYLLHKYLARVTT